MTKIKLTQEQKETLEQMLKKETKAKIQRRLLFVKMNNQGMTNQQTAFLLSVTADTLTDWTAIYKEKGLKGLGQFNYEGRRISKLEKKEEEIKEQVKKGKIDTLKDLKIWLKENHDISTCISNLFYYCKKNSIFLTKKLE